MLKRLKIVVFFAALAAVLAAAPAVALEDDTPSADSSAQLPVPRFVSLATDEVNLRTGPGLRYPVRLVLRRSGLPVEVVREFDVWRQVRDIDGDEGWVHKSMLSGRRAVVVRGQVQTLRRRADDDARSVARLEPGVIARLKTCAGQWCELSTGGYSGWLKRDTLWGVYPNETFKE